MSEKMSFDNFDNIWGTGTFNFQGMEESKNNFNDKLHQTMNFDWGEILDDIEPLKDNKDPILKLDYSSSSECEDEESSSSYSSSSEDEEYINLENRLKNTERQLDDLEKTLEQSAQNLEEKNIENERLKEEVKHHISQNDIMFKEHQKFLIQIEKERTNISEEKNYLNYVISSWYNYSQTLLDEIQRKEEVIKHKDEKATRLIEIIRKKNAELNRTKQNLKQVVPSITKEKENYLKEEVSKICEQYQNVSNNDTYFKFTLYLESILDEYILNVPNWISNLKLEDNDSAKIILLENFITYSKFRFSTENSDDIHFFEYGWGNNYDDFITDYLTSKRGGWEEW